MFGWGVSRRYWKGATASGEGCYRWQEPASPAAGPMGDRIPPAWPGPLVEEWEVETPLSPPPVLALHESHLAPPGTVDDEETPQLSAKQKRREWLYGNFCWKVPLKCLFVSKTSTIWQERKKLLSSDPMLWANKPKLKPFMRVNSTRRTHSF